MRTSLYLSVPRRNDRWQYVLTWTVFRGVLSGYAKPIKRFLMYFLLLFIAAQLGQSRHRRLAWVYCCYTGS
jgi:hypothetical protein